MKANELMIGDWVFYMGKPYYIIAIESDGMVKITTPEKADECRRVTWPDRLEPIPLTPEILEKNGFVKRYNYQWEYCDNSCKIEISIAPQIEIDGEMLGEPPINVILEGALFDINMTSDDICVHNLQHALRLCGIDKEIGL